MQKNLTANEVAANKGRCSPTRVRVAILAGALLAYDRGPGHEGRRARFLIKEADADAWVAAGCPITKEKAGIL